MVIECESPTEATVYEDDGPYEAADCKDFTDQFRPDISIKK